MNGRSSTQPPHTASNVTIQNSQSCQGMVMSHAEAQSARRGMEAMEVDPGGRRHFESNNQCATPIFVCSAPPREPQSSIYVTPEACSATYVTSANAYATPVM
jgi:hypothetical protein